MSEVIGAISESRDEVRVETGNVNTLTPGTTNTLISLSTTSDEKIHGFVIDGTAPGTWSLDIDGVTRFQISTTASQLGMNTDLPGYLLVASGSTIEIIVENVDPFVSGDYHVSLVMNNE